MRKVLAVLATITLCACFLSVFSAASAEDAPSFDEVFAGEFAEHATAPEDWAVDGYWGPGGPGSNYVDDSFSGVGIDTGLNADGSMHVYRGGTSAGRIMTYTATSYVFDGAHIALGNITGVDHFSLELVNGEGGSGTSWIIFKNDGDMMQMYNGWGGEGTVLYEKSPVVATMFEENAKSIIGCSIVDTYPVFSVTNHAGTMSATIHTALSPSVGWTENTEKVIFGFGDWDDPSTVQLDVYAIHGGDEACGADIDPDTEAVKAVEAAIEAIGEVTLDSKTAIDAAHAAYDALTDAQKALVSNLNVLKAADFAYEALFYAQFRNRYNVNLPLKAGDIEALYATTVNVEQFEEGKGVIVDQWAPDTNTWAERTQLNHAVPLDGLRIVLTDLQTVRESGNTISIGLMDYAGQWVDADDSMIVWLFAPLQRQADGAGEYGYLHAENKKNGIQYSKCLWQSDFVTDIWSADQVVFEFAYDTDSEMVGIFVNDQYMGSVTVEDLGVDDVNAVIPHFSLWGVGVCHYGVYSVTSKAQTEGIQAVIDAIDAIGEVDPDDEACLARIEAASEAYKALDKNLRGYVANYDVLVDAKAKAEGLNTEEPSEPTEEPEVPTENPKTGEAVGAIPSVLLLTAAGALLVMRKRRA